MDTRADNCRGYRSVKVCRDRGVIAGAPPTRFACGRDKQVSRSSKCPSEILYAKTPPNNFFANLGDTFALKNPIKPS